MSEEDGRQASVPASGNAGGDFWVGFLGAGIPIVACSLLSVAGNIGASGPHPYFTGISPLEYLWFLGALAWLGALVAMIVAYVVGQSKTGTGILAALAIGLLVLSATCFANLALPGS